MEHFMCICNSQGVLHLYMVCESGFIFSFIHSNKYLLPDHYLLVRVQSAGDTSVTRTRQTGYLLLRCYCSSGEREKK